MMCLHGELGVRLEDHFYVSADGPVFSPSQIRTWRNHLRTWQFKALCLSRGKALSATGGNFSTPHLTTNGNGINKGDH